MKVKSKIKSIYSILTFFGLVLLLLLSPCKVRNYIQSELGIPQTEVSNKNKTTISNSTCNSFDVLAHSLVKNKTNYQFVALPSSLLNLSFLDIIFHHAPVQLVKVKNLSESSIPLYILYKNFKNYL